MEHVLDRLCDVLTDELERQQLVLAVLEGQRKAALDQDIAYLDAKTEALENLIREEQAAEPIRHDLMKRVVEQLQIPPSRQSLSELIRVAPEPYASRLREFQTEFRNTLFATRDLVRNNSVVLNRSLHSIQSFLASVSGFETSSGQYASDGRAYTATSLQPALLNQRG